MEFAFMRPENISGMMTPDPATMMRGARSFYFARLTMDD
jgi:hypothetical protein